ncbi:MAG: YoaK family protein [Lysobacteraceae bacterium]
MPLQRLSQLTASERIAGANLQLGVTLAAVAGALNAGGFLAIGQYTSHMSGVVSNVADMLVLQRWDLVVAGLLSLLAFLGGAMSSALLVNFARRRHSPNPYTTPLLLEAALLLVFGLAGSQLASRELVDLSLIAILLCYVMGLQNALVTKISNAVVRTTHVTGLVTDIGIELGKMVYWNRSGERGPEGRVRANSQRLRLHASLLAAFFLGGVMGALGFSRLGYIATLPLASLLGLIALAPRAVAWGWFATRRN